MSVVCPVVGLSMAGPPYPSLRALMLNSHTPLHRQLANMAAPMDDLIWWPFYIYIYIYIYKVITWSATWLPKWGENVITWSARHDTILPSILVFQDTCKCFLLWEAETTRKQVQGLVDCNHKMDTQFFPFKMHCFGWVPILEPSNHANCCLKGFVFTLSIENQLNVWRQAPLNSSWHGFGIHLECRWDVVQ